MREIGRFDISEGNLKVLEAIPKMMVEEEWRAKLRKLAMEFIFKDITADKMRIGNRRI